MGKVGSKKTQLYHGPFPGGIKLAYDSYVLKTKDRPQPSHPTSAYPAQDFGLRVQSKQERANPNSASTHSRTAWAILKFWLEKHVQNRIQRLHIQLLIKY